MSLRRRELFSAAVGFLVASVALAVGAYFWGTGVEDRIADRIGVEDARPLGAVPPVPTPHSGSPTAAGNETVGSPVGPPRGGDAAQQPDQIPGLHGEGGSDGGGDVDQPDGSPPAETPAQTPVVVDPSPAPSEPQPSPSPKPSRSPIADAVVPTIEGVRETVCNLTPAPCEALPMPVAP